MTFQVAKLGEVCSFIRGLTYSKSDEVEFSSNIVVRATNINLSTHKLDFNELRYISDSIQVKEDKRLKKNDILMCTASGSKSHLGKVALVESDLGMAFGGFMGAVRVNPQKITPQYLFTFLVSSEFKRHIESLSDGANINNLKFSQIEDLELPLPPLTIQIKIVEKLDAIFAEIDKAIAAAEVNVKNAEALFQSYLTHVFERGGEGWLELSLQELLDRGWIVSHLDGNHGSDYPRKEEFIDSGVPYISANCLDNENVDMLKSKFLSKDRAAMLKKGVAVNDDVLFAHNATVGPVAVLKTNEEKVILGTSLTYYRCDKNFIKPSYLANYMRSMKFKRQYLSLMRQSTRNQVPITKQRNFFHVIPPIEIQGQLLDKFNVILDKKFKYERVVFKKINALKSLRNSILKNAFYGELIKE